MLKCLVQIRNENENYESILRKMIKLKVQLLNEKIKSLQLNTYSYLTRNVNDSSEF